MRNLVFLFVFIFSPLAQSVSGYVGKTETDKLKGVEEVVALKTVEEEIIEDFSEWKTAEGSYYDPMDSSQTKNNCDGIGKFGRVISHGSISIGSPFTDFFLEKNLEVYVKIKDFNIVTPYGVGIFRVDDTLDKRYQKGDKFFIDFFHKDLSLKLRQAGRFKVLFKIIKISSLDETALLFL